MRLSPQMISPLLCLIEEVPGIKECFTDESSLSANCFRLRKTRNRIRFGFKLNKASVQNLDRNTVSTSKYVQARASQPWLSGAQQRIGLRSWSRREISMTHDAIGRLGVFLAHATTPVD